MARTVKAPAANSDIVPRVRHGVAHHGLGCELVERCLEQSDKRHAWQALLKQADAGDVGWIVRGGEAIVCLHGGENTLVEPDATAHTFCQDSLEADGGEVA